MAKLLPADVEKRIKRLIYERADAFGYACRNRTDNSIFMDELVTDPEIGGILREYYPGERVRTYIKDAVLNAYTKQKNKQILKALDLPKILTKLYAEEISFVQKIDEDTVLLRAETGRLYVVGKGTILKWETALRRALDAIANHPNLQQNGVYPKICLMLAVINGDITDADKNHIRAAIAAIGVSVYFCR